MLSIPKLLNIVISEKNISSALLDDLTKGELDDQLYLYQTGINPDYLRDKLKERGELFLSLFPDINQINLSQNPDFLLNLWRLWLPLSIELMAEQKKLHRPLIQGILGGQGTGKTTLGQILQFILSKCNSALISISLDDLYKTYLERQELQKADPRLIWRGPPGTHDIELGINVLDSLRHLPNNPQTIAIPRFDKSLWNGAGDRVSPEIVTQADIVLFEGWFVAVKPIDPYKFSVAPYPIITERDRQFALDMNKKLGEYLPLWQRLDQLIILDPVDYQFSKKWRKQAEQEMIAKGKPGMTDAEINQFVEYFWKALHPELFIKPLIEKGENVNLVIEINADHSLGKIYHPRDS
jgi:D-glycerate 3-kinase